MSRLGTLFSRLRTADEIALLPYLMAGFPDVARSAEVLHAMAAAGADAVEIGIPFSDPMADGLTLQRANEQALRGGATVATALELARTLRRVSDTGIIVMSYCNPLLTLGERTFARQAADAGADAVIVPDLPPEESGAMSAACTEAGLDYIYMLGPTSTPERLEMVSKVARGFIYCVALVGVTGARSELADELDAFLGRVRAVTDVPLVVGFGIAEPEHVRALRGRADGAIVASALADLIERLPVNDSAAEIGRRVSLLKAATRAVSVV